MERSEALDIIRKNWPKDIQYTEALRTLIPELKESEDERIRKDLIDFIKDAKQSLELQERDNNKWQIEQLEIYISWLEKRGENIKFLESVQIGDEVTRNPDGVLVNLSQFKRKVEQGSQNLANSAKTCKVEPKSAEKVEAKQNSDIEKGKWYVCDTPRYADFAVGKAYYCPKNGMLKPNENEMARYVAKNCFHLWTIQDAKDGDVLSNEEMIVIFKHFENPSYRQYIVAYIGLDTTGNIQITDHPWFLGIDKAKPATKEQRDLLFQKMGEAGCEWDAEKKELRKIEQKPSIEICPHSIKSKSYFENGYPVEQKPADKVEPIEGEFPYNNPADTLEGEIDNIWRKVSCDNRFSATKEGFEEVIRHFINFVRQKPAWSEEDEKMIEFWNLYYEHKVGDMPNKDVVENLEKFRDWLKALKDKYTWKPSKEQIEAFEHFVRSLGESGYMSPYDPNTRIVYSLLDDLKKLKG